MARRSWLSHKSVSMPAIFVCVALAVSGCTSTPAPSPSPSSSASPSPVAAGDGTLVIGALLPGTGEGSKNGVATEAAVRVAVNDVNANGGVLGKPVRLVVQNSGGSLDQAISAFTKAGVDVVVGAFPTAAQTAARGAFAAVVAPIAQPASSGTAPSAALLALLHQQTPNLGDTSAAAETVDAVVLVALSAVERKNDNGAALADGASAVASGGFACTSFGQCAQALAEGQGITYRGQSGTAAKAAFGATIGRYGFVAS